MGKIFFDLSPLEYWHRREWENMLCRISEASSGHEIVSGRSEADFIVRAFSVSINDPWREQLAGYRGNEFVWDSGDLPSGAFPGLYCSLKRNLFSRHRHRTFSYPIVYNEVIDKFDLSEATLNWTFFGGITSRVRKRLVQLLAPTTRETDGQIVVQGGTWTQMFDRSGIKQKVEYAAALKAARFVICPRGNGVGSIRLFEVLKAGRVPVIVADKYVLPNGIDWGSCAIICKEKNIASIPALVNESLHLWDNMARSARRVWEAHFSDKVLLWRIASALEELTLAGGAANGLLAIAREKARVKVFAAARSIKARLESP
jgi:hypothetical protein